MSKFILLMGLIHLLFCLIYSIATKEYILLLAVLPATAILFAWVLDRKTYNVW